MSSTPGKNDKVEYEGL